MRPYPEEVQRAVQNVMMQHFAPQLTGFNQRELGIVMLLFNIIQKDADSAVPDLIAENAAIRALLDEASATLATVTRDAATACREEIAVLATPEPSLRISALRKENDALRAALVSLTPLIEPAADDPALAPLRDIRTKIYAHLSADAKRRTVPMLG